MPVCGVESGEGPGQSGKSEPAVYVRVFANVEVVIEADELMPGDLRVNGKGDDGERAEDPEV